MRGPSPRQADLLRFVRAYRDRYGFAPTVREIGEHLGIGSTNAVCDLLAALERKGLIARVPGSPRAIALEPRHIVAVRELRDRRCA